MSAGTTQCMIISVICASCTWVLAEPTYPELDLRLFHTVPQPEELLMRMSPPSVAPPPAKRVIEFPSLISMSQEVVDLHMRIQRLERENREAVARNAAESEQRIEQLSVKLAEQMYELKALEAELLRQRQQQREELTIQRGAAMREQWSDTGALTLAWSLNDVGLLLLSEARFEEAESLFRRALALLGQEKGKQDAARGTLLQHIADTRWRSGDLPTASLMYREAVQTFESALGSSHPRLAAALNGWATVLRDMQRSGDAEAMYLRAVQIYERRNHRDQPPDIAAPLHNLGLLMIQEGRLDEGGTYLTRAWDVLEGHRLSTPSQKALVLRSLAQYHLLLGDAGQAMQYETWANDWSRRSLRQ